MSYILDALRKADAQRERDPARGIHAQPARTTKGAGPPNASNAPWVWAGAAAGLAAIAVGGWYLFREVPTPGPPVVVAVQAPAPAAVVPPLAAPTIPRPVVAQAVMPPPVVVAPPVIAVAPAAPVPNRAERLGARQPPGGGPPPAQPPGMAPAGATPAPAVAPAGVPTTAPAPAPMPLPPAATLPGEAPVAAPVAGLPPDAPKLTVTGGVYSASKAQRMLIVNGSVVAEGADLGSGVTLEEIRPKTAVLRFRGARYTVGY